MDLQLVMFAYLRFKEQLHELTGFCHRPNLNQTWWSIIYFIKIDGCIEWHKIKI